MSQGIHTPSRTHNTMYCSRTRLPCDDTKTTIVTKRCLCAVVSGFLPSATHPSGEGVPVGHVVHMHVMCGAPGIRSADAHARSQWLWLAVCTKSEVQVRCNRSQD